jgi:hypothetical protein
MHNPYVRWRADDTRTLARPACGDIQSASIASGVTMKVILLSTIVALLLAIGAAVVLDGQQVETTNAFTTTGARL